jgi:YD repeat-containing protein
MRTFKLLSLLLAVIPLWLNAQQTNVIPPSPEAASVFKFTEVPVSAYSGLANVSIPLFEVKAGKLTIPVNLSYHGRGIRVEEIAPRVGIGWTLNYGGMISRQVRAGVDDMLHGYLTKDFYTNIFTNNAVAGAVNQDYNSYGQDLDPDLFMFDFPGGSGKFQFDQRDKEILQQKYSNIKILPIFAEGILSGWIVTDKDGTKYYFGISKDQLRSAGDHNLGETNYSVGFTGAYTLLGTNQDLYYTTWHLMDIETPEKEVVEFFYEMEEAIYYQRKYDRNLFNDEGNMEPNVVSFISRIQGTQYQISEIRFRNGKLKFVKSNTERKDIKNAYALDRIELIDKRDSILRTFSFKYNYPQTIIDGNVLPYLKNADTSSKHRLFLQSVQEKGIGGDTIPPYTFVYSNQKLPNRFSNSQDSWGFYNGKNNGTFLTFFNYSNNNISREVDTVKAEAGLLKKINYPTGGYVAFQYEQNIGRPPLYWSQLLYPTSTPAESEPAFASFFSSPTYFQGNRYVREFTINSNLDGGVRFEFEFLHPELATINYTVFLEGEGLKIYLYPNQPITLALDPGLYKVSVLVPYNYDPSNSDNAFQMMIEWKEWVNPVSEEEGEPALFSAGKRIKRIEYHNSDGAITSFKEYKYIDPETGNSSGMIFGLPNFYFIGLRSLGNILLPIGYDRYGSIPGSPLTNLQGNSVGYYHVTEFFGDTLNNIGKIEYQFTTPYDAGDFYKFPYTPPIDNEWLRGKPTFTSVYEKIGSDYVLKKTTENTYLYAGQSINSGVIASPLQYVDSNATHIRTNTMFSMPLIIFTKDTIPPHNYKVYYQTGGTADLYSTTETNYERVSTSLVENTFYNYDYDHHYNISETKTVRSDGDSVIVKTTYPITNSSPSAVIQKLIDQNRLATPLSTKTTVKSKLDNSVLSDITQTITYTDWGSNLVEPSLITTSVNAAPPKKDVQIISYDSYGNPTEMIGADGIRQAFIWGYNSEYPVAKISGATYNIAKSFIDENTLNNAHQFTDYKIRSELNKIRSGLSSTNAIVSTYTYQPLIGMRSEVDARGKKLMYDYDNLGRLSLIRDNDSNIVKRIGYSYGYRVIPEVFKNVVRSGTFTRNNCGTGRGVPIIYTVPAGTYTSTISQQDADQQAQNDVNANGQNYANTNGTCQIPIYVTIDLDFPFPTFTNGCVKTYSDVLVHFYRDAAKTIPYSVNNLTIQIRRGKTIYSNGNAGPTTYTTTSYTCNGNSFTLPGQLTLEGCASGCPEGFNCLPGQNDPQTKYSYDLIDVLIYVTP